MSIRGRPVKDARACGRAITGTRGALGTGAVGRRRRQSWETNWISDFERRMRCAFVHRDGLARAYVAARPASPAVEIVGEAELFAPGIASTDHSEVRLTISPDGRTALWFSRDRPGGAGGYDIWMSRRTGGGLDVPRLPVPFNSPGATSTPLSRATDASSISVRIGRAGSGGDDLYRVAVTADGFGAVENLGSAVNSAGNEFAPMLSPDGQDAALFERPAGGAGRHDLYTRAPRR
jgi:TolB protein